MARKKSVSAEAAPTEEQPQDQSTETATVLTDKPKKSKRVLQLLEAAGEDVSGYVAEEPVEEIVEATEEEVVTEEAIATDETEPQEVTPAPIEQTEQQATETVVEPVVSDEWEYGEIGALKYRRKPNGDTEIYRKIDGQDEWISDRAYIRGHQFNEHLTRKEKELKELEQRMKQQEEVNKILESIVPRKQEELGFEDDDTASPQPVKSTSEIEALRRELSELKGEISKTKQVSEQSRAEQALIAKMDASYNRAKVYAEKMGLPFPGDVNGQINPALQARIIAVAENQGVPPAQVAVDPVAMIEIVESLAKNSPAPAPKKSEKTPVAPKVTTPSRKSPAAPAELAFLLKERDRLKGLALDKTKDQSVIATELLNVNRKLGKLSKGA